MLPRFLLILVGKIVRRSVLRHMARFEEATHRPRQVQEELLRGILSRHADTDFGRRHGFGGIHTVEDFRRQLPIAGYDYFAPYIERVRRGEFSALLNDRCVHMFAMTSGTTAARKYIPVTPQYLADYRRGWNIWGMRALRDHLNARARPIVQMSSDWDEFRTEAGIPCGSVTGLTAHMQKRLIRRLYCVPAATAKIKDATAKLYVALRLSVPRRVGMIVAANPSTLINLARLGDLEKETLIRDIHDGGVAARFDVPADVRAELKPQLRRRDPGRARELEEIVRRTGALYPRDYWPAEQSLLGTWTGGSVGNYLRLFPRYYGDRAVRDVGLIASEGRMTIPVADGTPSGVLDITSHYFEFIPEDEVDRPRPTVLAAHELREGSKYYILPTTAFGLYRYHIHDLVRVTGFYHGTPLLEFLGKGAHFSSLTGEKLSEYHVTQSMQEVVRDLELSPGTYALAPCWDDQLPYYGLFIERGDLPDLERGRALAAALDRRLMQENVEYADKRRSLRLGPIRLELLAAGAWTDWDRGRLKESGGTPEQYKHPCLIADPAFRNSVAVEEELAVKGSR